MQSWIAPDVRFISEQDGSIERDLQAKLLPLFRTPRMVRRAYLARISYGEAPPDYVALLLVSPEDPALVGEAAAVFRSMFHGSQQLDMLFLSPAQEQELRRVCKPFFVAVPFEA